MDFSVGVQLFRREMAKMARLFRGLFCDWLPAVIVGLPLAAILILCHPLKHIRIYSVDCHRIGHLLKHYFYLCEKPLAEDRKNDFHYLIHPASKACPTITFVMGSLVTMELQPEHCRIEGWALFGWDPT